MLKNYLMIKTLLRKTAILFFVIAPTFSNSQVLLTENFSSGTLPIGWTNDSLGFSATHLWDFNNPFSRYITGSTFDANFAIFDADQGTFDDGYDENSSLTTPSISLTSASFSLFLEFDEQFRAIAASNIAVRLIKLSTDGGLNWTTVDSTQSNIGYPNPAIHSVYDISTALSGSSLLVRFQYIGSWDWWWAIDNVKIVSRQPCTAPPNAGTAVSNLSSACNMDTFSLSLTGSDVGISLSYQWQISSDSINWTDLAGDTTESIFKNQSVEMYYRCGLTCNGQTSYSLAVFVPMSAPTSCYCIGIFDTGCDAIDKVEFNTLSNIGTDCNTNINNYINYPANGNTTTVVWADSSYDLTFASGLGSGNHGAAAWFDFNQDGDFQDAGEFFHISDSIPESSSDFITPITIPITALGFTRMRIRYIYNNAVFQSSDCDLYGYGETEDYTIEIKNALIGLSELTEKHFYIYPTPASDYFIAGVMGTTGPVNYLLFDQVGRTLMRKSNALSEEIFNVTELKPGIYFLLIETTKGSICKKLVTQ